MLHIRQSAVHAAGFGIDDLAVQQVVNEEAALGQVCVRLGQIVHPAHLRAGGVHIGNAVQPQQDHIALCAHTQHAGLACALGRAEQPLEFCQKRRAVTERQGLHFAAHAVGGHDLAGGKIVSHIFLLIQKKHFTLRQSAL